MSADSDAFVRAVIRSGLLEATQFKATLRNMPDASRDSARQLADYLIDQGQLTRFQAHKLLQGISVGLVIGPYQLEAVLGRGGMGNVYLARDNRTGTHIALKVLPPKRAREEVRQLARFLREKDLAQRVRHPHVALTYEVGEAGGIHYIAMEYIPGQTLYRLVGKEGPLAVPRAARLFTEVAIALGAAHAAGLIHRDMKPSNIMVTPHDHAKILDLGLAFMTGEEVDDVEVVGGKGYVVGSIDYMAPEQTRDATGVDARADIYGLGCCLYFALTGKPPFPTGTLKEKVLAHRQQEPESVRARNPAIPERFAQTVHRLLAKDPDERFPDAYAVALELRLWGGELAAQPVETAGDAVYQQAVQEVVTAIPVAEPYAANTIEAMIFKAEPDSPAYDPVLKHLWWIALLMVFFWLFASFLVVLAIVVRFLLS